MAQSGIQPDASCSKAFQLIKQGVPNAIVDTFSFFDRDLSPAEDQEKLSAELSAVDSKNLKKIVKFIIFKLHPEGKKIVVRHISKNIDYEEFIKMLPKDECCWAIYDFAYETPDGPRSKLVFVSWTPDTAKIKSKMMSASSKQALKSKFDGIHTEIQATDYDEISYETVLDKA
ncbi:cofilin [Mycoemilia scoparia]|uniref:Cofilin n=1 Tax=Mycoemilia scoparia TaxID=417184 RepID=A0A9W8A0J6_9FUNG|nr:cofilin [Mycoemilia scoparia]